MYALVRQLSGCLEVPADETFKALLFTPASQASIERVIDRNGLSDRID
jgi:hypothetical protein